MFCIRTEQGNAGCNEIELNRVAKLQNVSCGGQSKKKKVKQKQKMIVDIE